MLSEGVRKRFTDNDWEAVKKFNISEEQLEQWEQEVRNDERFQKYLQKLKEEKGEKEAEEAANRHIYRVINSKFSDIAQQQKKKKKGKKSKKKKEEEEEEILTLEDVKALPDYVEDNHTMPVYVVYRKTLNGSLKEFFSKVLVKEDGKIEEILLEKPLSIPRETAPSPDFLNKEYGSLKEIYNELKEIHKSYIRFEEDIHYDETVLTAMASYFREIFYTYPFLDFWSEEQGCGKTTAMETVAFTSFYGTVTASFSEPVVFREIDDSHCVYGFDNIDRILEKPRDYINIVDLWNSSYSKNIPCKRVENIDDRWVVVNYDGYSIKMFTHIRDFSQSLRALKSRCIRFVMIKRQPNKSYPAPEKFIDIRDKLYHARLKEYKKVKKVYSELVDSKTLTGRTADLYYPLLAIAKLIDKDVYKRVLEHAKRTEEDRNEYSIWNRVLVQTLIEDKLYGEIDSPTIRDHYEMKLSEEGAIRDKLEGRAITTQSVTKRLKGLGFKRTDRKTDNKAWFLITEKRVKELAYQYGLVELENNTPSPKPNFSNFSNSEGKNDDQKEVSIDDILVKEADRNEIEGTGEEGGEKLEKLKNGKRTDDRGSFLIHKNNDDERIRKERISSEKRYVSNFSNSEGVGNTSVQRTKQSSLNNQRKEEKVDTGHENGSLKIRKLEKLENRGGIGKKLIQVKNEEPEIELFDDEPKSQNEDDFIDNNPEIEEYREFAEQYRELNGEELNGGMEEDDRIMQLRAKYEGWNYYGGDAE